MALQPPPAPPPPTAATISVGQTLDLLGGPFRELAAGVAEGQYAFWLGSGISREAVDDLRGVVIRVVQYLSDHANSADPDCPFARALAQALGLAQLSEADRKDFDPTAPFADWPPALVETLQARLVERYSDLLDIRIAGKDPDFILWEVVDVPALYANPALAPLCEHLCLAILAIEGVLTNAPTANWDGLIEKAIEELAGPATPIVRVCVVANDFAQPQRRLRLLKFHGCAVMASGGDPAYRGMLVGRARDIEDWARDEKFRVMRHEMVGLATVRHTLMIGLSAQDINIRDVFRDGQANMNWPFPSHPPRYVFAEETVGDNQRRILSSVYRDAYDADPQTVTQASHLRAFAKPLLLALVLDVLWRKLSALTRMAPGHRLSPEDFDDLAVGLQHLRDRLAAHADGDRTAFVRAFVAETARALLMFRGVPAGPGAYQALGMTIAGQIPVDPNNAVSGLPELSTALGLLGLGEAAGDWTVARADPTAADSGAFLVTAAGIPRRLFLVANQEAALKLFVDGVVGDNEPDAVVVCSTRLETRPKRSPHRDLRPRARVTKRIGLRSLLEEAPSLAELRRRFREETVL